MLFFIDFCINDLHIGKNEECLALPGDRIVVFLLDGGEMYVFLCLGVVRSVGWGMIPSSMPGYYLGASTFHEAVAYWLHKNSL